MILKYNRQIKSKPNLPEAGSKPLSRRGQMQIYKQHSTKQTIWERKKKNPETDYCVYYSLKIDNKTY